MAAAPVIGRRTGAAEATASVGTAATATTTVAAIAAGGAPEQPLRTGGGTADRATIATRKQAWIPGSSRSPPPRAAGAPEILAKTPALLTMKRRKWSLVFR